MSLYVINSRDRVSGTNNNFSYRLDINHPNVSKVVVLSALIPKTYYLVQEGYNWFTLIQRYRFGDFVQEDESKIEIPPGNYNRQSFQIVLEDLLNDNAAFGNTFSIDWHDSSTNVSTGHYYFTAQQDNEIYNVFIEVEFIFPQAAKSNIHELMGFDYNSTYSFKGVDIAPKKLESKNVIKMQKEDCLLLHSNICSSYNTNDRNPSSILQEIYASSGYSTYSNIIYQNMGNMEGYARPILNKDSKVFDFWLTNEDFQLIDLNGLNFVFTLKVF